MKFVCVNGVTLHYKLDNREATAPLVFVNSLGTDLRIWDDVLPRLEGDLAILRHDQRGHGLSDAPPGPYTIRDLSNDLEGMLRHLDLNRVILVGISIGGLVALDYAIQHPGGVRALVLCDTAARIGTTASWTARIEGVRSLGMAKMAREIGPRWFASGFAQRCPDDYQGCLNMLARMPEAGYIATCEALREADFTDEVGSIPMKSLVLCGVEDAATPPDVARELAASLPNARFELIEQAGHLPCIEQPEEVAGAINRFLAEIHDA